MFAVLAVGFALIGSAANPPEPKHISEYTKPMTPLMRLGSGLSMDAKIDDRILTWAK